MLTFLYKDLSITIEKEELKDYDYNLDYIALAIEKMDATINTTIREHINDLIGEDDSISADELVIIDTETSVIEVFDNKDGTFGGYIPKDEDDDDGDTTDNNW